MVEFFNKGHLEEFHVPSLFHAWLYASQLSSALEYLESKHLVHTSVAEPFVYISSLEKVMSTSFCYLKKLMIFFLLIGDGKWKFALQNALRSKLQLGVYIFLLRASEDFFLLNLEI